MSDPVDSAASETRTITQYGIRFEATGIPITNSDEAAA